MVTNMSRYGVVLCQIYAFIITLCIVIALLIDGDPKGKGALLSVPIAFQKAALQELNTVIPRGQFYWPKAYIFLGLPIFMLLYFIGKLVDDEPLL